VLCKLMPPGPMRVALCTLGARVYRRSFGPRGIYLPLFVFASDDCGRENALATVATGSAHAADAPTGPASNHVRAEAANFARGHIADRCALGVSVPVVTSRHFRP